MRICLFSYRFLPDTGGIQEVSATLATAWTEAGHEVTLVTATPLEKDPDYDRQFRFRVVRFNASPGGFKKWNPILEAADLLVSNGVSLIYWPLWVWRRKPIVFIHPLFLGQDPQGKGARWHERWQRRMRLWARRFVLRRAAGNVFVSQYIKQSIGIPQGTVIYNPIDARFRPLPDVAISADFAYFGRMAFEKGVTDLLDALNLCNARGHRFTLELYGEGHMLADFKRHAANLKLESQLRWYPFARDEELVRAMNSATVVVVPSKWIEPMGIVAVEAMACGKCVIGSSLGGLGEVLTGYCPTYPNHDIEQLATQMIAVMTDADLRRRYEESALKRSKDFQRQKIAQDYIDYFRQVMG